MQVVRPETHTDYAKVSQVSQPSGAVAISDPTFWPSRLRDGFSLRRATSLCCRFGPCLPNIDWHVGEFGDRLRPEGGDRDKDLSEVLAMKSERSEWKSDRWVEFINQTEHRHLYIREETDWVGRTFGGGCPGCAETTYTVHAGDIPGDGKPEGAAMFRHEKKRSFGRKCLYGKYLEHCKHHVRSYCNYMLNFSRAKCSKK